MSAGSARRAGQKPPQSSDERVQQRLRAAEGAQAPWRGLQIGDSTNMRIVQGAVHGNGTVSGSGYTATNFSGGAGFVTVHFDQPFAAAPNVICSSEYAGAAYIGLIGGTVTTTDAPLLVTNLAGAGVDHWVHFIAFGPQTA